MGREFAFPMIPVKYHRGCRHKQPVGKRTLIKKFSRVHDPGFLPLREGIEEVRITPVINAGMVRAKVSKDTGVLHIACQEIPTHSVLRRDRILVLYVEVPVEAD